MPPKPAARRPAASRKKSDAIEIVVRRGSLRRFDALKTRTAELPVVVTWDRRLSDRREDAPAGKKVERRYAERRRTPPFTWDLADFVVKEPPKRRKSSSASKTQAAARKRQKTSKKS
ncbi:MAG TPA: hypothetical protein VN654_11540 [Vicinamibacterales bacterium]|jgi:hypothetical protein|nr:hypothetical protein [Vicinamibacterales bacterium]